MKQALVNGGAHGTGRVPVAHSLDTGWRVAAPDRDGPALAARPDGPGPARREADISDEACPTAAARRLRRLSPSVADAGNADPVAGLAETPPLAGWEARIATNTTGTFLLAENRIAGMRPSRGTCSPLSSRPARMSVPRREAHAASKGRCEAPIQAPAIYPGSEIRVNGIAPAGSSPTRKRPCARSITPGTRWAAGRPEEVACLAGAKVAAGRFPTLEGGMTRKMAHEP